MTKADSFFRSTTIAENFGAREQGHVPASAGDTPRPRHLDGTMRDITSRLIDVARIITKQQVRETFSEEELQELAHSLKTVGQTTPITVYWSAADDGYVVICGERRYRAARIAGIEKLSCKVHPHEPGEDELVELQFVENAIRVDLSPIEEARSYRKLQELKGYTTTQLAERIGKNQSTISRSLSLLKLPEDLQVQIADGRIPTSIAREIVKLTSDDERRQMAERYLQGELTTSTAQAETSRKSKPGKGRGARNAKKWNVGGITISVSYKAGQTLSDVAEALRQKAAEIESDGRTARRPAAA